MAGRVAGLLLMFALLVAGTAAAEGVSPQSLAHYRYLEAALARYQVLAADATLTALPPLSARSLRSSDAYAGAAALRRLLIAVGDLPEPTATTAPTPAAPTTAPPQSPVTAPVAAVPGSPAGDASLLDAPLIEALQRFQRRHGLDADGVLGPATWRALTTPMARRARQIELTLERWRQLPSNPWQRAIFINIPQFRLIGMHAMGESEAEMLLMDVVVGRTLERLRTPTFVADMTHVIFRPYWDVPRSIAVGELLPQIRARPEYLQAHNYEVVNGAGRVVEPTAANLDGVAAGLLRLRQRPGADNALGAVKFMLPNPHNVYLHDTPQRTLFARTRRAFSHGCVRVAAPQVLAEFALQGVAGWTPERIAQAMAAARPERVDLAEPVRVYIVYGTAIARENGEVLFFDDLYGLEKP